MPQPLYNLPALTQRPEAPVVVVEGEKCAQALDEVQADFVVTTWPGGALAVSKADFTPLAKRTLYLSPDNDDSGRSAMRNLALKLRNLGCHLFRVESQANWPEKYDVANLLESGWSGPDTVEYIKAHSTEIAAGDLDEVALAEMAALSPIEYDRRRKTEAVTLGVQTKTLDKEVEKRRPKDSGATVAGSALRLLEIEPWDAPVDGSMLLD